MSWILVPGAQAKSQPPAASGLPPMPDATNRPTFNSGNNTLSWKGPLGGGPSNGSYVQQSRVLTVVGGQVVSTGPNTVVEGVYATGNPAIQINHNNVTVRQCHAQNIPANTADTLGINIATGVTGTIIEDCLLDGNSNSNEGNCVSGPSSTVTGCTMRRNNCFQAGQAIRYTLNNISFTENYCHNIAGADSDWFECYPNGGTCNHLLVQYNLFTGPDSSVAGSDSGVNLSTTSGLPAGRIGPDVVIDSNWFVWDFANTGAWFLHSLVNDNAGTAGEVLEFTFTNNGIYNRNGIPDGFGNSGIVFGTKSAASDTVAGGGLIHDSGNYVMATPTSRTGTLYSSPNGAGRL